ncbi:MAG: hypothetical protein FJY98_00645 [Candidatus Liptonbacteria bacterium]|nr:hypothetical protein [Candidatus Liptonbacteria bacterium]
MLDELISKQYPIGSVALYPLTITEYVPEGTESGTLNTICVSDQEEIREGGTIASFTIGYPRMNMEEDPGLFAQNPSPTMVYVLDAVAVILKTVEVAVEEAVVGVEEATVMVEVAIGGEIATAVEEGVDGIGALGDTGVEVAFALGTDAGVEVGTEETNDATGSKTKKGKESTSGIEGQEEEDKDEDEVGVETSVGVEVSMSTTGRFSTFTGGRTACVVWVGIVFGFGGSADMPLQKEMPAPRITTAPKAITN